MYVQVHECAQVHTQRPEVNDRYNFCQDSSTFCFETGTWDPANTRDLLVLVPLVLREQACVTVPSF